MSRFRRGADIRIRGQNDRASLIAATLLGVDAVRPTDRLHDLADADQDRVWALVEAWAKTASDNDKIALREKIRVSTLSRHATLRARKSSKQSRIAAAAKHIHAALEPSNLLDKHAWLFKGTWIEESADELRRPREN